MTWGSVTVAGFPLRETITASQSAAAVRLVGQESTPPSSAAYVIAAHDNINQLLDRTVPVTFTDKSHLDGFYRVTEGSSELLNHAHGAVLSATWSLSLERIGSARDVEIESRVPTVGRLTDHAVSPVFWHAPAVGATSYWTGSTVPSGTVTRDSMDGPVTVHTGIPSGVAPRWTVPVGDYLGGSVRLLLDGQRRIGAHTPPHASWQVDNGLVRLAGAGARVAVDCWAGEAWESAKDFEFRVNNVAFTSTPEISVLRNDPEEVVVRLTYPSAPGRVNVDLSLRRGSRFVTGVVKRHAAATLSVVRMPDETASAVTGGILAVSTDADGNRYFIGSSKSISAGTNGIAKSGVTTLDFFVGHEVGSTPAAGDAYADLLAQYLGSSGERTRVVRR